MKRDDLEDDRPRRRMPREEDEEDLEDMPRRPRRAPRGGSRSAESRVYVHDDCDGQTTISGDDFLRLANPFAFVTQTFCADCERFDWLGSFAWADTGEDIRSYRRRLRRKAPLSLKLSAWVLAPLVFGLLGAVLGALVPAKGPLTGAIAGGLTGALLVPLMLIPFLARWIWGIDYRSKK